MKEKGVQKHTSNYWKLVRVPLGLSTAPGTFLQLMHIYILRLSRSYCRLNRQYELQFLAVLMNRSVLRWRGNRGTIHHARPHQVFNWCNHFYCFVLYDKSTNTLHLFCTNRLFCTTMFLYQLYGIEEAYYRQSDFCSLCWNYRAHKSRA